MNDAILPQRIYFCSQLTASLETLTTAHHLYPVWIEMVLRWIWVPRQSVSASHILSFFKAPRALFSAGSANTVRFLTPQGLLIAMHVIIVFSISPES